MNSVETTFNILKNHRYKLTIDIMPNSDKESDIIIDNMRTTLDIEPTILDTGEVVYYSLTLEQLVAEVFCLGVVFSEIESNHNIVCPFDYSVERV